MTSPDNRLQHTLIPLILAGVCLCTPGCKKPTIRSAEPIIIAHRGASGYLPEHTLEAYSAAYFMGADMIEPDIVATRDHQLVCFHDLYLEKVTDVEQRFPSRSREDGHWYVIDFDLEELRQLSVTGRGEPWQGMQIPTFAEMLTLVTRLNTQTGRDVGVAPEIKKPGFHMESGLELIEPTIRAITQAGWAGGNIILQCFDQGTLESIHEQYGDRFRLLQLASDPIGPDALEEISRYAYGIGPSRTLIEQDPELVPRAHALGLKVIAYTFKNEPREIDLYIHAYGIDGLFSDYPHLRPSASR